MADAAFALMTMGNKLKLISPPAVVAGQRGDPALSAPDVPCWPLDYLGVQTAQRLGLDAPAKFRQTVIEGRVRVPRGSYVLFNGAAKQYPVKTAEPWDFPAADGAPFTMLVVEAPEA